MVYSTPRNLNRSLFCKSPNVIKSTSSCKPVDQCQCHRQDRQRNAQSTPLGKGRQGTSKVAQRFGSEPRGVISFRYANRFAALAGGDSLGQQDCKTGSRGGTVIPGGRGAPCLATRKTLSSAQWQIGRQAMTPHTTGWCNRLPVRLTPWRTSPERGAGAAPTGGSAEASPSKAALAMDGLQRPPEPSSPKSSEKTFRNISPDIC